MPCIILQLLEVRIKLLRQQQAAEREKK